MQKSANRHITVNNATHTQQAGAPIADQQGYEERVTTHMALVGHIVRETVSRTPAHVSRDDLTSAGFAALAAAARAFDPERGVSFASFAADRIRGAIVDELRGHDWASRSVRRRALELHETRARLSAALGEAATDAQVGLATGLPARQVAERGQVQDGHDAVGTPVLRLIGTGDALAPSSAPSCETAVRVQEQVTHLVGAVTELPPRLRFVIESYYLAERPMSQIAADLGVTEPRAAQIRAEALALLGRALHRASGDPQTDKVTKVTGATVQRRRSYLEAVGPHRTRTGRLIHAS